VLIEHINFYALRCMSSVFFFFIHENMSFFKVFSDFIFVIKIT